MGGLCAPLPGTVLVELTKVSRVVVGGAAQAQPLQVRNQAGHPPPVDALTLTQHIELQHTDTLFMFGGFCRARNSTSPARTEAQNHINTSHSARESGGMFPWKRV